MPGVLRPTRRAIGAVALAAGCVLASGVAALAGPAGSVAPGAALCAAAGQPVSAAKPDGVGGYVCPSGKTLALVAAQEAVELLDGAVEDLEASVNLLEARVADLQGQVDALGSRTALSLKETAVPWAMKVDGTFAPARFEMTCGSEGKAISGSAKTTGAAVTQSHVSNSGASWTFEIQATSSTPQARAFIVCMGPSGASGTAPAPGGG